MNTPKTPREAGEAAFYECEGGTPSCLKAAFDAYEAAAPDFRTPVSKLLAAFDELQSMTAAERIVTGRSDARIKRTSNEAVAELRAALSQAKEG